MTNTVLVEPHPPYSLQPINDFWHDDKQRGLDSFNPSTSSLLITLSRIAAITGAKMLSRRIARASALASARPLPAIQQRTFIHKPIKGRQEELYPDEPTLTEAEDPGMNGGYINPPEIKRQFRDPHADWWDKQERRNYGEPVHENHDQMGMFTPYEYTWVSPAKGAFQSAIFIAAVLGLCYVVKAVYPDKKSYPREFEGGLEKELGGAGTVRARMAGDADP